MNDDSNDSALKRLNQLSVPAPSDAAKKRALAASMAAFEAAKTADAKIISTAPQGMSWAQRLKSMFSNKGNWTMDIRIPLGTAAFALLLFPLGYQLYTSTSLTPFTGQHSVDVPVETKKTETAQTEVIAPTEPVAAPEVLAKPAPGDDRAEMPADAETTVAVDGGTVVATQDALPNSAPLPLPEPSATTTTEEYANTPMLDATVPQPPGEFALGGAEGRLQQGQLAESESDADMLMRESVSPSIVAQPSPVAGMAMDSAAFAPPPVVAPMESGDEFADFAESPVKAVAEEPVSTFSIDVDTASYSYMRRQIEDGYLPEPDAVRIEEMINYFPYDYPAAASAAEPFKPTMAIYPTPWNPKTQLLQIGIKGYVPAAGEDKPSNLVFLFDTSGSMDEPDKLPLLKRAFTLLVESLSANDTVSIVTYAGSAGVALEPTKATDKAKILAALDNLYAGGSTAGGEGIELAYRLAEQAKIPNGINRVILATDGDFNVGIADPEDLKDYIKTKRDGGISLSVLGFGQGNLDDATMQALAQNGNGNASYIDSFQEARKVLVEEGGSTLEMIAKDVKIQIEFNPAFVSEYRLVGYETRALNREDFNNDTVDAGDIGAGHTVTAIYEITPAGSGAGLIDPLRYGTTPSVDATTVPVSPTDEIAFLKMRYKLPNEDVSKLIETPVTRALAVSDITQVSDDMRFAAAVAAFGQKLKGSDYGSAMSWDAIRALANGAKGSDDSGYRAEFVQLIGTAALLSSDNGDVEPTSDLD